MSLDVWLKCTKCDSELYVDNITHNLNEMAMAAGLYEALWRPDEHGFIVAGDIIQSLDDGVRALRGDPERFRALNPRNGWGTYEQLVTFVDAYLAACRKHPDATICIWR